METVAKTSWVYTGNAQRGENHSQKRKGNKKKEIRTLM